MPQSQSSSLRFARPDADPALVTVHVQPLNMLAYVVSASDLEVLGGNYTSVNLALSGTSVGVWATIVVALLTVPIDDPKTFAAFVAAAITTFLATIFFGIAAYKERKRANDIVATIRRRRDRLLL